VSDDARRTIPTVVVARRPAPGRSRDFERWLKRLTGAAARAPGHRQSDIHPPNEIHPGEWVIIYQFDDAGTLHDWLTSSVRAELIAGGVGLMVGEEREQVMALGSPTESVTAVASFCVRPGQQRRYAELHQRLVAELERTPGFLRSELFDPVPGVQDDTVVVFSFDSRGHLDEWLGSEDRKRLLDDMDAVVEGDRTINVVGGFGGWFGAAGSTEVKRWKQAAVVLLALFPTALVLTLIREAAFPDLHWVPAVFLGNLFGVIVLSWLLMPFLTKLLAGWLRR